MAKRGAAAEALSCPNARLPAYLSSPPPPPPPPPLKRWRRSDWEPPRCAAAAAAVPREEEEGGRGRAGGWSCSRKRNRREANMAGSEEGGPGGKKKEEEERPAVAAAKPDTEGGLPLHGATAQQTLPGGLRVKAAAAAAGEAPSALGLPQKPPGEDEEDAWHYNSFQYWRSPLPAIDLRDILDLVKDGPLEAGDSSSVAFSEMET